jgi:hypothetical protein
VPEVHTIVASHLMRRSARSMRFALTMRSAAKVIQEHLSVLALNNIAAGCFPLHKAHAEWSFGNDIIQ